MKRKNKPKPNALIFRLIIMYILFSTSVFVIILLLDNSAKASDTDKLLEQLNRFYSKIDVNVMPLQKSSFDIDSFGNNELPDIANYHTQVESTTADFIEIWSSPEKAYSMSDSELSYTCWLIDVANEFNAREFKVNGQPVSVSLRGLDSGIAAQYIMSNQHLPDAYMPSSEIWGDLLKSQNIDIELKEKRLAGNVAGIVLSKDKTADIIDKYGEVTIANIAEAVSNDELSFGYTNPIHSTACSNFLLSLLYSFDPENPTGGKAQERLGNFSSHVPFVSQTTLSMKRDMTSHALDGFLLEYQQFVNSPELAIRYTFTPFGVRHDNPVYTIGNISDTKQEILRQFIEFAKNGENQRLAKNYGFNYLDDYVQQNTAISGSILNFAYQIWKQKKDGAREMLTVFVVDSSAETRGTVLNTFKQSLIQGLANADENHYIGLVASSDGVNIDLPISKFDLNGQAYFMGALENMQSKGKNTLINSIITAQKMIADASVEHPDAKTMIVVLTQSDISDISKLDLTEDLLNQLNSPIITIAYNTEAKALSYISYELINVNDENALYNITEFISSEL